MSQISYAYFLHYCQNYPLNISQQFILSPSLAPTLVSEQHWVSWKLKCQFDRWKWSHFLHLMFLLFWIICIFSCVLFFFFFWFFYVSFSMDRLFMAFCSFSIELSFSYWCMSTLCLLRKFTLLGFQIFSFEQRYQYCQPHRTVLSLS